MMEFRKSRTVYSLPGGPDKYLVNLAAFLRHLSEEPKLHTRQECVNWLARTFPIKPKTSDNYFQMICRLGLALVGEDKEVELTETGLIFLASDEEGRASQVAEILLQDFLAFPETLGHFATARGALASDEIVRLISDQFDWETEWSAEARVDWLTAVGCLKKNGGGTYQVTERGLGFSGQYPPDFHLITISPRSHPYHRQALQLAQDMDEASVDGKDSRRFEHAVADAFRFLGFMVEELGGSGTTDLLISANIGPASYKAVVDTKARHEGKLDSFNPNTLEDHRDSLNADYMVVVARRFTGEKVHRHARGKILLLSTPMLRKLLLSHAALPLSLSDYRDIFQTTGELIELPQTLVDMIDQTTHAARLVRSVVNIMQKAYSRGWDKALLAESITPMLVTHFAETNYDVEEVRQALHLLTHPTLSAAAVAPEGFVLTASRGTLARKLRMLADIVETEV